MKGRTPFYTGKSISIKLKMKKNPSKIVPINWIEKSEQYALIPGHVKAKKIRRVKALKNSKGNCFFTSGISKFLVDFIYRAVIKLELKDKIFLFSKGAVKQHGKSVFNAVGISHLDWDVGISIRIPHKLNYNYSISLFIKNKEHKIRLMELFVLSALLHIAFPKKNSSWCSDMSASIIAKGWDRLNKSGPLKIIMREYQALP